MGNLEFSVPYNNDPETLAEIFRFKEHKGNRIREIYLSGPQEYSGSGRIAPGDGFRRIRGCGATGYTGKASG